MDVHSLLSYSRAFSQPSVSFLPCFQAMLIIADDLQRVQILQAQLHWYKLYWFYCK